MSAASRVAHKADARFSEPSLVVSIVFDMTLRHSSVASLTVIVSL
jgi:hypothetical protein